MIILHGLFANFSGKYFISGFWLVGGIWLRMKKIPNENALRK